MGYIDFEYYKTTFGGSTIPEAEFIKREKKARVSLDNFTFDRLKKDNALITDVVKDCMCEMMDKAYSIDQEEAATEGQLISSESVDGHSVSYAISDTVKNAVDRTQLTKIKLYNIAKEYLGNTGLLYRGF